MFDTIKVAQKIKEKRIAQNMTQMNLADAMEVSYQAVSNWERGNSCPDISKLEQLCGILHIKLEELMGFDKDSETLTKMIHIDKENIESEPITIEELQQFAPIIPPATVEKITEDNLRQQKEKKLHFSAIIELAPFLDSTYLDKLVLDASIDHLKEVVNIAPFLSHDALDKLIMEADLETDIADLIALAPFIRSKTLDKLALEIIPIENIKCLEKLAPFLSKDTLNKLVLEKLPIESGKDLVRFAPFLPKQTLQKLVQMLLEDGNLEHLKTIVHFL